MLSCKQCGGSFDVVGDGDRAFYTKIDVPEPNLCIECRRLRRMCWRNERTFYPGKCRKCGTAVVSCFSENSPIQMWCNKCWWSDEFDARNYGRDFNFNRPFFEQFHELLMATPVGNLFSANSENSDYSTYSVGNKNCYMASASDNNEDCFYADNSNYNRSSGDISMVNQSELIYDSVDCFGCYMCTWSQNLTNSSFCHFCADLIGCKDCIGCVGLRNAQYCIFNKKYTKEEFEKELKKLALDTNSGRQQFEEKFRQFNISKPRRFSTNVNCENVSGNYVINSRNCRNCFDIQSCEDCSDTVFGYKSRDLMDVYGSSECELGYESVAIVSSYNVQFCCLVWPGSANLFYSFCTRTAKNCLGCVSMHRNEYCILNKQYSPEEYEKMFAKIKGHMMKTGEWGEYFPMKYAPWSYNETVANDFEPKTREEILKLWAHYEEKTPGTFGRGTLKAADIPDDIADDGIGITDAVLECGCDACGSHASPCARNYKIISQELAFYKKAKVPIPSKCPICRYRSRMNLRTPRQLWKRNCSSCNAELTTAYSPDRPEKILCESCYQLS